MFNPEEVVDEVIKEMGMMLRRPGELDEYGAMFTDFIAMLPPWAVKNRTMLGYWLRLLKDSRNPGMDMLGIAKNAWVMQSQKNIEEDRAASKGKPASQVVPSPPEQCPHAREIDHGSHRGGTQTTQCILNKGHYGACRDYAGIFPPKQ